MLKRFLTLLLLAVVLGGAWVWRDFDRFLRTPLAAPEEGLVYMLRQGASLRTLAADLKAQGALSNAVYLRLLGRWTGIAPRIQAGEYRILRGTLPLGLLRQLAEGAVITYALTLVEGWTFLEVMDAVRGHHALDQTLAGLSGEEIMQRLGHPGEQPEGRFFPDTYHFPRGTSDRAVLQRAYTAMERLLDTEWPRRASDLPLRSPYEALILASIVERETALASERAQIAGVFIRRLSRGMKLQTDPTVIYGMGNRFAGNLTKRDLQEDTPYNTYVHPGLTPTPICMPGRDAVQAVLHPAGGDSLYFVARGDGSHEFSATLAAHNRAVRTYQLNRR